MSIVGGLDLHRRQLTYDHLCLETGEIERGRIVPGDREHLRAWLARIAGEEVVEFALMDIPELDPTLKAVARVLRPAGWFVFSNLHPATTPRPSGQITAPDGSVFRTVSDYFTEGFWRSDQRPGPPGRVGSHHRTLGTYINTLTEAGLVVERLSEPRISTGPLARLAIWHEVPAVLIARCRRAQAWRLADSTWAKS